MKKKIMRCIDISKQYDPQRKNEFALKKLDLDIFSNDFTVIMGSSGSGKSTLLQCISGMDNPTTGSVEFNSMCITKMNDSLLSNFRKKNIGFIFQNMNLIEHLTALENVTLSGFLLNEKKTSEIITNGKDLLYQFGLSEHTNKFPNELSGGQQQRVAIARALINSPQVLFADEPTGALNSKSGIQVLDILTKTNLNGQSIVMVTHDLKAALRANRIIYLIDGSIQGELLLSKYIDDD
ncbi:ABC transporter ATP-binding protein, partial [Listeria monocytogenes]|nr:ABC transporter ATP-binding protein [Listeria monocytogenes]